jgi:glutathione S-transferase
MPQLYHFPLCPFSRRIRVALGEIDFEVELVEERPWERREEFLIMNPAGTVPVLVEAGARPVAGISATAEYLEEIAVADGRRSLIPGGTGERAEVRRLVEWFDVKFNAEVTGLIAHELIWKRFMAPGDGGGGPDMAAVRVGRQNIGHHLDYISYLTSSRRWLAGDELSHADLAAAAHLSCIDYVGDVPWERAGGARDWYARIKSRPSFRPLLKDQLRGMAPPPHYEDLDF